MEEGSLKNSVCIVTGAAGLLGRQFANALLESGATVCMLDIDENRLNNAKRDCEPQYQDHIHPLVVDIAKEEELERASRRIIDRCGKYDVLINNAANNPQVGEGQEAAFTRFENFSSVQWDQDIRVGLSGAYLCSKVFGSRMAQWKKGVIVNICSDLSVIAPDQRIYRDPSLPAHQQPAKPVSYSVIKTGLVGLTRYLSTYWADSGVRVNALSPGGVYTNQPDDFVERLTNLIPMGRMADIDEYKAAIVFLCSEASKYMTGQNLVIDGGRTAW